MLLKAKNSTLLLSVNGVSPYFRSFGSLEHFISLLFYMWERKTPEQKSRSTKPKCIFLIKINTDLIPEYFSPSSLPFLRLNRLPLSKPLMSLPRDISSWLELFGSLQFSYKQTLDPSNRLSAHCGLQLLQLCCLGLSSARPQQSSPAGVRQHPAFPFSHNIFATAAREMDSFC